jgi:signal transduction histidine kinase
VTSVPTVPGRRRRLLVDAVLALGLALLCWYAAAENASPSATGWREPGWVGALAGAALGLPVAARRRRPLLVTAWVTAVAAVVLVTGVLPTYAAPAPVLVLGTALYVAAVDLPRRPAVAALVAATAATAAAMVAGNGSPSDAGFVVVTLGATWAVGRTVRERRAHAARTAEQATERAVQEERLRIARDVHDVVAHSMSLIAVKAAVANHVAEQRPQEAREALRIIESTSRNALVDLRRALGALRTETSFGPAPGLAGLPALADRAGAAGVTVELDVRGGAEVPESVGLSVFRIVQESLTNAVRHAAPAHCRVDVTAAEGAVHVSVADDGRRAPPAGGSGQGIVGMRERVGLHRGDFAAGPRPGGGFLVTARLPYADPTAGGTG